MAITHFRLTELPNPILVETLIDNVPLVANTDYPIADQNKVVFNNTQNLTLSFTVSFLWQVIDSINNIESEIEGGFISFFKLDTSLISPDGLSTTNSMNNDETVNILNVIDINDAVEEIIISKIEGINNWKLNGNPINPSDIIKTSELLNLDFNSKLTGGGNPYTKLLYQVKNTKETNPKELFVELDIVALAEIELLEQNNISYDETYLDPGEVVYDTTLERIATRVYTAHVNSTVQIEVIINSDFLALNAFNEISFEELYIIKTANETFNVELNTDSFGVALLNISQKIVNKTAVAKNGNITLNLLSVNNDVNLISGSNNSISIITTL